MLDFKTQLCLCIRLLYIDSIFYQGWFWGSKCNENCKRNLLREDFVSRYSCYLLLHRRDWLSTALISALIGQFNRTVRVMTK